MLKRCHFSYSGVDACGAIRNQLLLYKTSLLYGLRKHFFLSQLTIIIFYDEITLHKVYNRTYYKKYGTGSKE